jgi:Protein of unknown function (DUF3293)
MTGLPEDDGVAREKMRRQALALKYRKPFPKTPEERDKIIADAKADGTWEEPSDRKKEMPATDQPPSTPPTKNTGLLKVYYHTTYSAKIKGYDISFNHGESCAELDRLLVEEGASSAAVITAWNPGSAPCDDETNHNANQKLKAAIEKSGYRSFPAWGADWEEKWPAEDSFLVLGISQPDAEAISEHFLQNAYVFYNLEGPGAVLTTKWMPNRDRHEGEVSLAEFDERTSYFIGLKR